MKTFWRGQLAVAFIALLLLSMAESWLLYSDGGVHPSSLAPGLILIALTMIFFQIYARSPVLPGSSKAKSIRIVGLLIFAFACFQLVPLPLNLINVVSPGKAELMRTLASVSEAGWTPISVNPDYTALELTIAGASILVLLLSRQIAQCFGSLRWLTVLPLVLTGVAEAARGLQQAHNPSGESTATGSFSNRNHLACFLEMLLPFGLAGIWVLVKNTRLRFSVRALGIVALGATSMLFAGAILYTYSRMGFVVVLMSVLLLALVLVKPPTRQSKRGYLTVFWMLLLLLLMACYFAPKRLLDRFENASAIDIESTDLRLGFWKDSFRIANAFPMTGCGLGGFESVYPRYQTIGSAFRVEYLHNEFLQALVELGIPASVAGIIVMAALLIRLFKAGRSTSEFNEQFVAGACFASACGMLLHSFVDFTFHIPSNSVAFAWIVGLGLSMEHRSKAQTLPTTLDFNRAQLL